MAAGRSSQQWWQQQRWLASKPLVVLVDLLR